MADNDQVAVNSGYDKREDFRVDDTIPIAYRPLGRKTPGRACAHADVMPLLRRLKAKGTDPEMLLIVKFLDEKLNAILNILEERGAEPTPMSKLHDLNISAGGLSFMSNEPFKIGETLSLIVGLPPHPYTNINILGEVLRCDPVTDAEGNEAFKIGVRFMHLDEEDRQGITRYLFDVQRRAVKAK